MTLRGFAIHFTTAALFVAFTGHGAAAPDETLPPGAVARLGSRSMRQFGSITALTFGGGSNRLLAAGSDGLIRSWDPRTGAGVGSFDAHDSSIVDLRITPDNEHLYAVTLGQALLRFRIKDLSHPDKLIISGYQPTLSPKLDHICAIATDGVTFELYDMTGKLLRTIDPGGGSDTRKALDATFSLDGSMLALSSYWIPAEENKSNKVANVRIVKVDATTADEEVKSFSLPKTAFSKVRFLPDGKRLLCAGRGDGMLHLVDLERGVIEPSIVAHQAGIASLLISNDGSLIVTGGGDGVVNVYRSENLELLQSMQPSRGTITSLALTPDNSLVAVGASEASVRVFETMTGTLLAGPSGFETAVCSVSCSMDGKVVATGTAGGALHFWDPVDWKPGKVVQANAGTVNRVTFSPTEGLLAAVGQDGRVAFFDVTTGEELKRLLGINVAAFDAAFTPNGQWLLATYADGFVRAFDVHSGKLAQTFEFKTQSLIFSVAVSHDGKRVAAGASAIRLFDPAAKVVLDITSCKAPVQALIFSADDSSLIAGLADGSIRVYDSVTGDEKKRIDAGGGRIADLCLSRDGKQVLACTESSNAALVLDVETLEVLRKLEGHEEPVLSVAWLPDGRILTGSADLTALIWK